MSAPVSQLEQVYLTEEAVPGTLLAQAATDIVDAEEGSVSFELVAAIPAERNDASGRLATKIGAPVLQRHYATGIRMPLLAGTAAGNAPPWGKLLKAAGFTEVIVGATSVTYGFPTDPNAAATDYALSVRHEVGLEATLSMHGARAADIVIESRPDDYARIGGRLLGGYNAPAAGAFSAKTEYGSGDIFSLLSIGAPFTLHAITTYDIIGWRLRIPMQVGMIRSGTRANGYRLPGVVTAGRPPAILEVDVVAHTVATYDQIATSIAATSFGASITLTSGLRTATFSISGCQWQPRGRQPGAPTTYTLRAAAHWDGNNQPVVIALT